MARMHPPEFNAADGDNPAERKLFNEVRDSLPEPWEAFHSIDWLERNPDEGAQVGEIDFALAHPDEGILTLEVKGGGIECEHGAWRRKKPSGKWESMKDPVKQVRDNQFALARLLKRTPEWSIDNPFMSHGLVFPLSSVHQFSLGTGTDPAIIIDRTDLKEDLPAAIQRLLAFHRGARDKRRRLGQEGVQALTDLLVPTVKIRVPLGERLLDEEAELESLTHEQSGLLRRMRRDPRMVITGCAGSGKTMLAINHARRLATDGYRVLFTCFNTKLRDDLKARYSTDGLEIESVHSLAVKLSRRAELEMPTGDWDELSGEFWNREMPDKLVEASATLDVQYDALMIDEAQDLDNRWLDSLTCLLTDSQKSPVWLFMDDNQNVYGARLDVPDEYRPFELNVNCRNTRAIHREVIKKYAGSVEPDVRGPEGRAPELVHAEDQAKAVAGLLERLCGREEIHSQDVVVLSSHGTTNSRIFNEKLPGRFQLTDKRPPSGNKVFFSSIRGFKGLESSVVVLCELEDVDEETLDQQLYVGLSRAKTHCVVVAPAVAGART